MMLPALRLSRHLYADTRRASRPTRRGGSKPRWNRAAGMVALAITVVLGPARLALAQAAAAPVLTPEDYRDESKIAALLWQRSPEVLQWRQDIGVAASEVTRARKYPNPVLDFNWGTIPVGKTNPPGLSDRFDQVPSYTAGISELVELAKRGPREAAAVAELERSRADALATLAERFFDTMDAIGRIARNQLRASVLGAQAASGERLLGLDRARADKGDIAVADLNRAEVEQARLVAERDAARSALESARMECTTVLSAACPSFESGTAAQQFLDEQAHADLPTAWSEDIERRRPDLSALAAALRAAKDRATWARRQAIPDVTLRLGYTYDNFVVSGDQRNSLAVGLQIPLPVLDRGKADLEAASAALVHAQRVRQSLAQSGRLQIDAAIQQRRLIEHRISELDATLTKAAAVRDSMEGARRQGGVSQTEVLLARRTYQELSMQRADLQGEAYDVAMKIRRTAALFPTPGPSDSKQQETHQ